MAFYILLFVFTVGILFCSRKKVQLGCQLVYYGQYMHSVMILVSMMEITFKL